MALIDNRLKSQEALYAASMFKFGQKEIERIKRKVREGINILDLLGPKKDELFKFRNQLRNELLNNLSITRNFGAGQVRDELDRQREPSREAAS